MATDDTRITKNHVLRHLPANEYQALLPKLELVELESKQELNDPGTRIRHIYFPIDCAISLMNVQPQGQTIEVGVVGSEGCTGFEVVQGSGLTCCRTIVQVEGSAFRIKFSASEVCFLKFPVLCSMLTKFTLLMFRIAVISVGCSQFHTVLERLCRWLLAHEHRTGRGYFSFTHDFLSEQLGVHRGTVTEALAKLQALGAVKYSYGNVELTERGVLLNLSCHCFSLAKEAIEDFRSDIL